MSGILAPFHLQPKALPFNEGKSEVTVFVFWFRQKLESFELCFHNFNSFFLEAKPFSIVLTHILKTPFYLFLTCIVSKTDFSQCLHHFIIYIMLFLIRHVLKDQG